MKRRNNCENIRRKLSRYVDNESPTKEKDLIESHLETCAQCLAEKEELQKLTAIFDEVPDIVPAKNSETRFWERVRQKEPRRFRKRIRSLVTEWELIPTYYSAAALLFLGLVVGFGFSNIYESTSDQDRLNPLVVEYFALHRMDSIPYNSVAGVYSSGVYQEQNNREGRR